MKDPTQISPASFSLIQARTKELKFSMGSEIAVGCLLRTLAASKPKSRFLELGTGTGLATAWILDGMDRESFLTTVDNDPEALKVAREFLGNDDRVKILCEDAAGLIKEFSKGEHFDFIFADTWAGKYTHLDEVLQLLNPSGFYIVDDMLPQPNWPEGHQLKVDSLLKHLSERSDLNITTMAWSCGVVIATKLQR